MEKVSEEKRAMLDAAMAQFHRDPTLGLRLCRHPALHHIASQLFKKESVSWSPFTVILGQWRGSAS